jgi:hypothetical protein
MTTSKDHRKRTAIAIGFALSLFVACTGHSPSTQPTAKTKPNCADAAATANLTFAQYRLPYTVTVENDVFLAFHGLPKEIWDAQIAHNPEALSGFKNHGCSGLELEEEKSGEIVAYEREFTKSNPGTPMPADWGKFGKTTADFIDLAKYPEVSSAPPK